MTNPTLSLFYNLTTRLSKDGVLTIGDNGTQYKVAFANAITGQTFETYHPQLFMCLAAMARFHSIPVNMPEEHKAEVWPDIVDIPAQEAEEAPKPDFYYDPENWERTYDNFNDVLIDSDILPGRTMELQTLFTGPVCFGAAVPVSLDEMAQPAGFETKVFDSLEEAEEAIEKAIAHLIETEEGFKEPSLSQRVYRNIRIVLGDQEIKDHMEIKKDLGADSLDAIELIMALEEEFEIDIDDQVAEGVITVADCITVVEERVNTSELGEAA